MSLLAELKRRNVVRTAVTYAVVSWLLIQIGNTLFTTLDLGVSANKLLLAILLLGFIPTVLFSWAFEITPEGIKHERDVERDEAYTNLAGKRLDIITIFLVIMAMLMFSYERITGKHSQAIQNPPSKLSLSAIEANALEQTSNGEAVTSNSQSIAVLAFNNMSQDKSNSYFSDGISEEILNALVKVKGLRVVARSSSFAYKGQNSDLRELGQKLNAGHLLDGSVRRDGNRVRINAQLINAKDGFQIWSEVYDREVNDIFTVQEEIAQAIVNALRLNIMPDSGVGKVATSNLAAYDFYLQGTAKLREANIPGDYEQSVQFFDKALALDNNFAEAHAGRCEAFREHYNFSNENHLIESANTACSQALSLNPEAPQVLIAQGELFTAQGEYESALKVLDKAIELRPFNARAFRSQGYALVKLFKYNEAIASFSRAIELEPEDGNSYIAMGLAYFSSSQYENAAEQFLSGIQLQPNDPINYSNLGAAYFYLGEFGKAAETFKKSIDIVPNAYAYSNAGTMYYFQGDYEAAYAMLEQAVELSPSYYLYHGNLADTCRWLEKCSAKVGSQYQEALNLINEALKVKSNDSEMLGQQALYLARIGKIEDASKKIKHLLTIEKDNPDILNAAALIAAENKNNSLALKHAMAALKHGYPEKAMYADPDLANILKKN